MVCGRRTAGSSEAGSTIAKSPSYGADAAGEISCIWSSLILALLIIRGCSTAGNSTTGSTIAKSIFQGGDAAGPAHGEVGCFVRTLGQTCCQGSMVCSHSTAGSSDVRSTIGKSKFYDADACMYLPPSDSTLCLLLSLAGLAAAVAAAAADSFVGWSDAELDVTNMDSNGSNKSETVGVATAAMQQDEQQQFEESVPTLNTLTSVTKRSSRSISTELPQGLRMGSSKTAASFVALQQKRAASGAAAAAAQSSSNSRGHSGKSCHHPLAPVPRIADTRQVGLKSLARLVCMLPWCLHGR
jgi:hypothetical protein